MGGGGGGDLDVQGNVPCLFFFPVYLCMCVCLCLSPPSPQTERETERSSILTSLSVCSQLHDDPHEELAKLIFMELSDAWAKFEEEGMKSLY